MISTNVLFIQPTGTSNDVWAVVGTYPAIIFFYPFRQNINFGKMKYCCSMTKNNCMYLGFFNKKYFYQILGPLINNLEQNEFIKGRSSFLISHKRQKPSPTHLHSPHYVKIRGLLCSTKCSCKILQNLQYVQENPCSFFLCFSLHETLIFPL